MTTCRRCFSLGSIFTPLLGLVSGWLHGKLHPLKGTPLEPHEFLLRPGSLVAMNSHVAHNVGSVGADR